MCMSLKLVTLRNSYSTAYVETTYTSKYRWVLVQLHQHELIHIKLSVMKLSWNIPYEKLFLQYKMGLFKIIRERPNRISKKKMPWFNNTSTSSVKLYCSRPHKSLDLQGNPLCLSQTHKVRWRNSTLTLIAFMWRMNLIC